MGLRLLLRKVRWSVTKRGVLGSAQAAWVALRRRPEGGVARPHPFDEQHGTDTGGVIGGGALAAGHPNDRYITAYAGVAPSRLRAALDRWEEGLEGERLEAFSFVDLGCGKGRAMLLASERPFREVLGVELSAELVGVAQRNVVLWEEMGRQRAPIRVVQGDATELAYPDGPCLVFVYNSFGVPVVRAVLEALHRHVQRTGARVDFLFQNEGPEMPMREDGRLRPVWSAALPFVGEDAAAEPVGTPEDVTSLYRFVG